MKVTLLHPITQAGEPRQAGDKIDVTTNQAKWLADHGVIEQFATNSTPSRPAAKAAPDQPPTEEH